MRQLRGSRNNGSRWVISLAVASALVGSVGCKGRGSPYAPSPEFGECVGRGDWSAPDITPVATAAAGEGQEPEYCGASFPTIDLAVDDPFAATRYQAPPDDLVAPFAACREALQASASSRTACDQVAARTLLVSQAGADDPRWQAGGFDGLYGTIQGAIDDAVHCDIIVVRPGTYREYLSIADKDVQLFSDTWNAAGTADDGDQLVTDYSAERIDLAHYYSSGERVVTDSRRPYLQPRRRAVRTILEGGGYAEGPTLGGTIARDEDNPDDPNRGCGNRRPMVDFTAGTTRNTIFDGFTVRLMPEQDHTIPGHGHTLQCRGGSPIIRYNIVYNNGSTGAGVHANWLETTPLTPPCDSAPELAQETFSNADYRSRNVEYRPVPLVYGNISYQNNGLGLGNNHYSCAAMVGNEVFWNAVPEEEDEHQSPGIGTRHGAKTYIDHNIVYENAWTGIGVRQGYLQPVAECAADPVGCNHIDERTQAVVTRNIVFANGSELAPEDSQGGIGVDGVGLPDEPVLIRDNVVFDSRVSGIGVRNEYAGAARGFVRDETYAVVANNTVFSNALQGISCLGSEHGTTHCSVVGNDSFWNRMSGIGFAEDTQGSALHNVVACNSRNGIQTVAADSGAEIAVYNNIAWANVLTGIVDPGSLHDYNMLSANNGQGPTCSDHPRGDQCKNPQIGIDEGGSAAPNDFFVEPGFCNPAGFDFGLREGSWAMDSGADISQYYSSWPREGNGPDRGSHEQ